MDTPFTPKTHISKRIKIWAVILLVAVILASGLAMLTGGKTRLFKGGVGDGINYKTVKQGETIDVMEFTTDVEAHLLPFEVGNVILNLTADDTSDLEKIEVFYENNEKLSEAVNFKSSEDIVIKKIPNPGISTNTKFIIKATISPTAKPNITFNIRLKSF